jgi:hypothetical protein
VNFEAVNALRDLDKLTPSYLREEMFAHGDLTTAIAAVEVLRTLAPEDRTGRDLAAMLRLV